MLTDAEFALLARELAQRTGQALDPAHIAGLGARLLPLERREGFSGPSELIAAARANGALWNAIAEAMLVTETRFFRERALMKAIETDVAPMLMRRAGGRALRVWSAGCAGGQEAFSLSIIAERLRDAGLGSMEIVGTDISSRQLDKARSGLYTQFEVQRGLPIRTLITFFEKAGEFWRLSDRLRARVRFEQHNLMREPSALDGPFDLIVCCNVLGGLTEDARAAALDHLAQALAPDGLLATASGDGADSHAAFAPLAGGLYRRDEAWRKAA